MPPNLTLQQAVLVADARGVRVAAQSNGFDAAEAERVVTQFGPRPAGVACPLAHFAVPFGRSAVAVVRVEDRPGSGYPLGFRFLVMARELYRHLGDPFPVADRYPPPWDASGTLPALEWPPEPLPPRTVEQVQHVLKIGDSPLLLGAAQLLIDGGRLELKRDAPAEDLIRGLWALLPDRDRGALWPASFAFGNDLGFHVYAAPHLPDPQPGVNTEEQARDYPEGRYELALQVAAEAGDGRELARLFARRTSTDTLRIGLTILFGALGLAVIAKLFFP